MIAVTLRILIYLCCWGHSLLREGISCVLTRWSSSAGGGVLLCTIWPRDDAGGAAACCRCSMCYLGGEGGHAWVRRSFPRTGARWRWGGLWILPAPPAWARAQFGFRGVVVVLPVGVCTSWRGPSLWNLGDRANGRCGRVR